MYVHSLIQGYLSVTAMPKSPYFGIRGTMSVGWDRRNGERSSSFCLLQDTKHEQGPYFPSKLGKAGSRAQTITHGSQFSEDDLLEMNRLLSEETGESLDSKIHPPPRPHAYTFKGKWTILLMIQYLEKLNGGGGGVYKTEKEELEESHSLQSSHSF